VTSNLDSVFLETNQVQLHIKQAGPKDGPLVILLHGFPEYWRGWDKQIKPLADAGFRLLIPDQRGYNLSEKLPGIDAYHISNLAADVVGLIDAAGCDKTNLVGHDWGAAVAWYVADRYPERLEKLAILNVPHPQVMVRTLLRSPRQILKSWYIFFFQIPRFPEWIMSRWKFALLRRMMHASANPGTFSESDLEHYGQAWSQPGALTAMINWYRATFRSNLRVLRRSGRRRAARIPIPTLMLWGEKDIALSREMAQPSINLCEQGELVFFENASHWVQHDEAERVTAFLLDFLGN
jgi:pimeloyl-ACP methyl ester carboxylesterase